jgi:nickel-dependent lactate racemase
LLDAGITADDICIVIATGLHRPNFNEELRELIGDESILKTVKIFNHFARDDSCSVYMGRTPGGLPIRLDRRFVEANLRIVAGLVEPHFMAGYSGGRKVIVPGIAHQETIRTLHSARQLVRAGVANCVLDGNPFHDEQIQAARMVGKCYAVNTLLNDDRKLCFVNFGSLEESHMAAVAFGRTFFEVPLDRPFRTVVTSASGYPLDQTYYQTIKGMVSVLGMIEPDSDIFIASECAAGLGTTEYRESQGRLVHRGIEGFLKDAMERESALIDEWESVMLTLALRKARIHLFSEGLTEEEKGLTGVRIISELPRAVAECVKKKDDKRVALVPEGPYIIPACPVRT